MRDGVRRSVSRALHATAQREQVTPHRPRRRSPSGIRVDRRWRTPGQILEARQAHTPAAPRPPGSRRQDLADPQCRPGARPRCSGLERRSSAWRGGQLASPAAPPREQQQVARARASPHERHYASAGSRGRSSSSARVSRSVAPSAAQPARGRATETCLRLIAGRPSPGDLQP